MLVNWGDEAEIQERREQEARELEKQIAAKPENVEKSNREKAVKLAFEKAGGVPAGFLNVTATEVCEKRWRVNIYTKTDTGGYMPKIEISHSFFLSV